MSEALLDKKFGYWQNQLLDLGKRNKMINYRETKRATLKLVEPEFEELFNRIAVNEEELTFQSPVDKNSDIRTYSVLSLLETLSCPIPVNIGDIKADGSILERQKTLKQMRSKSRLALDEQGTNILYLVSGFVEWKEKNDTSSPWIKSPLILVPVSLVLESINTPYILKKYDDDIVVNPTLAYLFERDYGIILPTFDPDEESLEEFMDSMEKLVDRKGWRVIRENSLGLVSFLKINMYKDLCNNEDNVKSNPIIRAFAGEDSELDEIPEELYNYDHDSIPSIDTYQVVNADSSQQDAILLSQKGVSFVMQGPPGTGKSQTITNIIAQGLADGKRILFVSEKAAALEVVYKRLSEVHLDDFCLALHNYKANKKEVLDELAKSLELSPIKVKAEETAKLTELDTLKEFLGQYVSDIHEEKMPLEMSLYEVYGALVALEDTIELPLQLKSVENMTKDQVNRLGLLVADFDKAKNNLGEQWYKNPWNGTNIVNVTYDLTNQINEKLTHTLHNIKSVIDDLEKIDNVDNKQVIVKLENISVYLELVKKCSESKAIPTEWIDDNDILSRAQTTAKELVEKEATVISNRKYLDELFTSGFYSTDAESKLNKIKKIKEIIESNLTIEKCDWNKYVLEVTEKSQSINSLYEAFDRILHEIGEFCDSIKVQHPHTICELYGKYRLHRILDEKYLVDDKWFETSTEECAQTIEEYSTLSSQLSTIKGLIATSSKLEIIERIRDNFNITEVAGYEQINEYNFYELSKCIEEKNKKYLTVKKLYEEIQSSVGDKVAHVRELPDRYEEIQIYIKICNLLVRDILQGTGWSDNQQNDIFNEKYELCIEKTNTYGKLKREVEEEWNDEVFQLAYMELLGRFRSEYQGFFKIFKKSYREDMKLLKGLYHNASASLKGTDAIILMLEKVQTIKEIEKWFVENEEMLQKIMGGKFCGINSDFMQIRDDREAYRECYSLNDVGSKLLIYIEKYNNEDRNYFLVASDLLNKLYMSISELGLNSIFEEQTLSSALGDISNELDDWDRVYKLYNDIKMLLLQPENITVSEFNVLIGQIIQHDKLNEEKANTEKKLSQFLGNLANKDMSNLQEIKLGIEAVDALKAMFDKIPDEVRNMMSAPDHPLKLEYSEESSRNIVEDLCGKLSGVDIASIRCDELQKQVESLLYNCDELQSENETVLSFIKSETEKVDVIECLEKLQSEQKFKKLLSENQTVYRSIFGILFDDQKTNWNNIITLVDNCLKIKELANQLQCGKSFIKNVLGCDTLGISHEEIENDIKNLLNCESEYKWICSLFDETVNFTNMDLKRLFTRWTNCVEQLATLDTWIDFRDSRKKCCEAGLESFVMGAEDSYYKAGTLVDCFMKMFYLKWIEINCAGTDSVAQFRTRIQESKIERFCALDNHQLLAAQMRIREKLISDMPNRNNFNRATDEMGVLLHELNKKRKIMPLRKLFKTIPNLLLKLKPCLMMSPLSVSYFLEAETYKFDMVIFDEASQIFPQDAIGAICRGKQVIIAGDSKQLPPTSFFAASTNNTDGEYDSDEEEDDVIYDSILEEATNSLPNRSLLWHYRSRNEDLIAFSNQEIYKNKLITFPSSNTVAADSGVEYVYVENGTYSGRCNIQEANKCVELIKEHIDKHDDRSLGIIAFSEKQQSTIEEAVQKFRERNPRYEKFFSEDKEEPFFIKNLENVQGDERDTIIFSICYAKDPNGRMYMRFGPLGHQGGERRLNVAITRAKHNIKLVGSIMPYDIDLSKIKSEGIRMLKDYIEFAIKGSAVLHPHKSSNALYETDEFCNGVAKFITSKGYHVKQYVGNSDYKIDIAVEHPKYPGCYVAGIECDGNSYYMARTTRDREHLRKSVLEQMGWKMFRVWSTEWINNKVGEQKRLLDFIENAINTYQESANKEKVSFPEKKEESVEVEFLQKTSVEPSKLNFPYYRIGDWRTAVFDYNKGNLENLSARIRAVVEVEQPIHLDLLYRRLASAFGNEKATKPIRYTIDQALENVMANEVVIEDGFVRFKTFTDVKARIPNGAQDRNIEYISKMEIADAMMTVIKHSYGIDKDALCAEVTSIFGYDRMGPKIAKAMNDTIDYMMLNNMVTIMDGKMHIK